MKPRTDRVKNKSVDFYIKPFKESIAIMKAKLPGTASRLIELFSASCTFAEEIVFLPPIKELAQMIDCGLSTLYASIKRINEGCKFLRFIINRTHIAVYRTDPDNPKNFFDFQNQESFPTQKNFFLKYKKLSKNVENQSPEPLPDIDSESPQTQQTNSDLPDGGQVDKIINKEVTDEKTVEEIENKNTAYTALPAHLQKTKVPALVTQKKYKIPQVLRDRLEQAEIALSEQILHHISRHHISQAYGAITHVENTWETIRDPKGVFLYQLPKQPVE